MYWMKGCSRGWVRGLVRFYARDCMRYWIQNCLKYTSWKLLEVFKRAWICRSCWVLTNALFKYKVIFNWCSLTIFPLSILKKEYIYIENFTTLGQLCFEVILTGWHLLGESFYVGSCVERFDERSRSSVKYGEFNFEWEIGRWTKWEVAGEAGWKVWWDFVQEIVWDVGSKHALSILQASFLKYSRELEFL
jgi:hypothetical protein